MPVEPLLLSGPPVRQGEAGGPDAADSRLARSTVAVLAGSAAALVSSLAVRVVMARTLDAGALGAVFLGISVVSFAGGVSSLGLRWAAGRRIAALLASSRKAEAARSARTALVAAAAAGAVVAIAVALAPALGLAGRLPAALLPALAPVVLGLAVGTAVWGISQGRDDTRGRALVRDTGGSLFRLAGVAAAAVVSGGVLSLGLGWALGSLAGEGLFLAYGLRQGWLSGAKEGRDRELLASLPPFFGMTFLNQARTWLDMLLLGAVAPLATVGTYGLAQSLGRVLGMFQDAAAHRFFPLASSAVARQDERGLATVYGQARELTFSFLWAPLAPCLLCPNEVACVAFGAAHAGTGAPLRLLAVALLVPAVLGYTDELLVARDQPGTVLRIGLLGTGVTAVALLALVPARGAVGAAAATAMGTAVRSVAGWVRLGEAPRRATRDLASLGRLLLSAAPAVGTAALLARADSIPPLARTLLIGLAASPAAALHVVAGLRGVRTPKAG